jgi:hypothetical protein
MEKDYCFSCQHKTENRNQFCVNGDSRLIEASYEESRIT